MKYTMLSKVNDPGDLSSLSEKELYGLCDEIREYLIENISKTGGHLSSNLGTVELTVAIHRAFHSPKDSIVFDVGHQSYTHKILTGRKDKFDTLRQSEGISGFPKPCESKHDAFIAGHASTSISAALGIAEAKKIKGDSSFTVAVIGDGAFTGGEAYEAINNAARSGTRLIIVLNHNDMSISKNVGGFARYLAVIRNRPLYLKFRNGFNAVCTHIPLIGKPFLHWVERSKSIIKSAVLGNTFFEEMGLTYLGPVDGHNLKKLNLAFERAIEQATPTVIQVETTKGKGYSYAEENPGAYHATGSFDVLKGEDNKEIKSYSTVAGEALCKLADENPNICAVTAAMKYGTGLSSFCKNHRNRFFDVGIAEGHAVTFSGGLASKGMLPVFCVYSTFLQRGYDQIIHDLSIEKQRVVFCIDRSGIVSGDGETHQGIYDAAFLSQISNVTVYSPEGYEETRLCIKKAVLNDKNISCVRYPKGAADVSHSFPPSLTIGFQDNGGDMLFVSYGREFSRCFEAAQGSKNISLLKLTQIHPLPDEAIDIASRYKRIVFAEEGIKYGGIGEHFGIKLLERGYSGSYTVRAIEPGKISMLGNYTELLSRLKLDGESLKKLITEEV